MNPILHTVAILRQSHARYPEIAPFHPPDPVPELEQFGRTGPSNHGAIPEVVVHGETGLLVTPRRPDLLAEAILKLAADGDLRQRMGALDRKRYEEYFTLEHVVDRLAGILDQGIQMKYC